MIKRALRSVSLPLAIAFTVAVAGALAWLTYRYELRRYPPATACSRALDATFDRESATMSDSLVLYHLLAHRDECIGDAVYVDQVRRLMLNTQHPTDARALLDNAGLHHAFGPDELAAQHASVDLAEARARMDDGNVARAGELLERAVATADRLRARWPEWSLPYRLLDDANGVATQMGRAPPGAPALPDWYALERAATSRILNGAAVRHSSEAQMAAFVFVGVALAMLGLLAGADGLLTVREMTRMPTSQIATATPGYVELIGTLHSLPGADVVIGPSTKSPGLWYELETNSGVKGAKTWRERSAQPFVLRDGTGDALIEPKDMSVSTRHSSTSFSGSGGVGSKRRVSERMLKEGDEAYVLGEFSIAPESSGAHARRLHVAEDGRRLLVSNYSEAELMMRERMWLWCGAAVFMICTLVLLWGWYQRYRVLAAPGVLT